MGNNTRKSSSRRAFDTVETRFFTEGDELSQPVPNQNEWDEEVTELVPRPKSKRKLVIGIAAAAVLLLTLAVLIF